MQSGVLYMVLSSFSEEKMHLLQTVAQLPGKLSHRVGKSWTQWHLRLTSSILSLRFPSYLSCWCRSAIAALPLSTRDSHSLNCLFKSSILVWWSTISSSRSRTAPLVIFKQKCSFFEWTVFTWRWAEHRLRLEASSLNFILFFYFGFLIRFPLEECQIRSGLTLS